MVRFAQIAALMASAFGPAAGFTVSGYVADKYCVDAGTAPDGAVMAVNPGAHTVGCMLLDNCVRSGYVVLANSSGRFSTRYVLDAAGNTLVQNTVKPWATSRSELYFDIEGTVGADMGNGASGLSVTKLTPWSVTGILADWFCIRAVNAPDGANMITTPDKHTVGCALLPDCVASGYALLQKNAATGNYSVAWSLDSAGNAKAVTFFQDLRTKYGSSKTNIVVTIYGAPKAGMMLSVGNIVEGDAKASGSQSSGSSSTAYSLSRPLAWLAAALAWRLA